MKGLVNLRSPAAVLFMILLVSSVALAAPITRVVAFGDSLSDTGNVFALTGYPAAPNWNGRQANGPVGVEYLAQFLGVPLTDFAFNGATTGVGNIDDGGTVQTMVALPGMTTTFNQALVANLIPIDPNALYVIWGGPNDFWLMGGPGDVPGAIQTAVTNLVTMVATLQALGVRNILVPGMPDPSLTPTVRALDATQPGTALLLQMTALSFNSALAASLPSGVTFLDTNALFQSIISNPGKYGLTNVTDPCQANGAVCANPGQYLFWDGTHPTTAAHSLVGQAMSEAVPEPYTLGLSGLALCLIVAAGRRLKR